MKPKDNSEVHLETSVKPGAFGFAITEEGKPATMVRMLVTPANEFAISISKPDAAEPEATEAIMRTVTGAELTDMLWLLAARTAVRQYVHHPQYGPVWVDRGQQGLHRQFCLCHRCKAFKPNTAANCAIAEKLFSVCKEHGLVTPVWECPKFQKEPA